MGAQRLVTVLALVLLLTGGGVTAQDDPPKTAEQERDALPARAKVRRPSGAPRIQPRGSGAWRPLEAEDELKAGDQVEAKDSPLELLFPLAKDAPPPTGLATGDRIILAPGARVTVDPPGDAAVRLEEGDCFATAMRELEIEAGARRVTVSAGDAEVSLGGGRLEVTPHAGEATVRDGDALHSVTRGQLLSIDARGNVKVKKQKPKLPKYVLARRRPARLILHEGFRPWPTSAYQELDAHEDPDGARSTGERPADDEPQYACTQVHLGNPGDIGGLLGPRGRYEVGARDVLRLRYRVSHPAGGGKPAGGLPSQLQLVISRASGGAPADQLKVDLQARLDEWTETELDLCEVAGSEGVGSAPRMLPGDRITYLTLWAGDHAGPGEAADHGVVVVLAEFTLYVPAAD